MLSRRTLLFGSLSALSAQNTKFSTDVNVVTLLATVHDRDGRVVKNLERDDFLLQDNGRPQTITYFTRESDLPLTIGLLVDTSRSQRGVLGAEKRASYRFLNQVLREDKDRAFVARFDIDVEVVQDFTSSRNDLRTALDGLEIPGQTATLIFEAVRKISEEQMRRETGRKAYILLSDGVSFRDPVSIGTAIEYAQRADVIIYSILFSGQPAVRQLRLKQRANVNKLRGEKAMKRLADETGGVYFEVTAKQPIEKIYAEIEDALRNQYSIGYTPRDPGKHGEYRKIKLTCRDKKMVAKTRDGYYAK
jgi:VWFA-related protein